MCELKEFQSVLANSLITMSYWARKLYSKKYAWATMSPYKSGTSNLPRVLCHSKINLAIKECLLLNIKIQQNKPSSLFLSCLHVESLVTTYFPHRYSVYPKEWCWCKAYDTAGIQRLIELSGGKDNSHSPFQYACYCSTGHRADPGCL